MKLTNQAARSIAAGLLLAVPGIATTLPAPQAKDDAKTRLDSLIQTRPAESTAKDKEETLRLTIKTLIESNRAAQIIPLGESAGPVLRELTEAATVTFLLSNPRGGAHSILVPTAPRAAVDYFHDLQLEDPKRFEVLLRSAFNFLPLIDADLRESGRLSPDSTQKLIRVIERTIGREATPLDIRVQVAVQAFREGFDSAAIRTFLREHLDLAFGKASGSDLERIASLVVVPGSPLPEKIPHSVLLGLLALEDPLITTDHFCELVERAAGVRGDSKPLETRFLGYVESRWLRDPNFDPAAMERIVRAFAEGPARTYSMHWRSQASLRFPSPAHALAAWRGVSRVSVDSELREAVRTQVLHWAKDLDGFSEARAELTLNLLLASESTATEDWVLSTLSFTLGGSEDKIFRERVHIGRVLGAIPAARVPEAVNWLVETESQIAEYADRNAFSWTSAGPELRAILHRADAGRDAWYLSGKALIATGQSSVEDRQLIVKRIAADAAQPESRPDAAGFFDKAYWSHSSDAALHWTVVSTALLENHAVPDEVVTEVPFSLKIDNGQHRDAAHRFLDAADARQRKAKGTLAFRNAAYYALRAAQSDPAFIRKSLLEAWLERRTLSRELVSAIGDSRDEALIARARQRVLDEIRSETYPPHARQKADWMLLLPGEDSIRRLVELALKTENAELVDHVDQRVKRFLSLQRAAAEWSTLASRGDSIEDAKLKVIALLDSSEKAVRVEAIYGLGTLGAIETLPRLIPLVASEDAEIREAARATLLLLRKSPASTGVQRTDSSEE